MKLILKYTIELAYNQANPLGSQTVSLLRRYAVCLRKYLGSEYHLFVIITLLNPKVGEAMARLVRVAPVGVPQHIIQRGNNGQVCFAGDEDLKAYLNWLREQSKKHQVDVHAWVLMTNHVHLLCTPQQENAVSRMMQSLGRLYVRYFNSVYGRTGTLWEGRFKSCLVQNERYLLEVYRYIELNPVRANMVLQPGDYSWSSYSINALGIESELQTPHPEYLSLGKTRPKRLENYRELFKSYVDPEILKDIRESINKGLALGNEKFTSQIERLTKQRVTARKPGRPRKSKNDQ